MGNCCSRFETSESMNPPQHASTPSSHPPIDSACTSGDPGPSSPPMDAMESIREMYQKIDPVELIDPLLSFIENQILKVNTPSEAESSSSEDRLATIQDVTKLAAKTIDIISGEAEKLSKSYAVKEMGSVMIKVMKGVGELHWGFIGLSIAAFAVESYMNVRSTKNECKDLLLKIVELARDVKEYAQQMPDKIEKVCKAVGTIVEGVVMCLGYLQRGPFYRFWSAKTAAEQLDKTNQQLRDVRDSLGYSMTVQILRQSTRRLDLPPLQLLDFEPVGIEEEVKKVRALLDIEGDQSTLAVIVCGFGGVGKSTLAAAVVKSLDWASTEFKFCRVAIDEKTVDKTSHILKLQKDIIYDLGGYKLDLRDPQEGQLRIKEVLQKKCSLLFIDNVVDKEYIQDLLPKDLLSGEQKTESNAEEKQKTKLRIILTSRDKNVIPELNINCNCKVHEVATLSTRDSQRLLFQTIVQGEVVEDKDFDEKCMINEVADACRGVPLLLSVFGKHLRAERLKDSYQEALDVLKEGNLDSYRDEDLGKKLMFIYEKVREDVKEAFLDICAYFHGWEWNLVADIVDLPKLQDLHRKMLVSSSSGKVIVHDILRMMGMEKAILTRFSNLDTLDGFEKVKDVKGISLVKDNGLITIQSTQLESMRQSLRVLIVGDWVTLDGPPSIEAFTNLRYLRVGDIIAFPFKDPSKLDKLRVFLNRSKSGMNLSDLPCTLKQICHDVPHVECDNFVKLPFQNLKCLKSFIVKTQNSVELPEELYLPASLVDLHINRCKNLPKDISNLTALESLVLNESDLECLPQGIGQLKKLKHLSMDYCSKLALLSEDLSMLCSLETLSMKGCRNLRALPKSLGRLRSLQTLEFSECVSLQELPESLGELRIQSLNLHSLVNLNELPNSFGNMTLLKDLSLKSCHSLMSLPDAFVELKMLETLRITKCTKLIVLPRNFGRLRSLKRMMVKECHLLKELPRGFGELPALKSFLLQYCDSFVNLPKDFTELTSLETLSLRFLPIMSSIPDGLGKFKQLRVLYVQGCLPLKTLSDDFENMSTLEHLLILDCPELDGAMIEKILKLENCNMACIGGSRKLLEKWEHMQGQSEHQIVVYNYRRDFQSGSEPKSRATRVALLHGKCMEVNNATHQLMERSSLLVGLEEGTSVTVAVIMLPLHMQSHQHQTLQIFVTMAREIADTNGSGKLQIVCARKVELDTKRPTPTEEEERAKEKGIRQILLSLPKGSCAIPSSEFKRVKILSECFSEYKCDDKLVFFVANVGVDIKGRKFFENFKFIKEEEVSGNEVMENLPFEIRQPDNKHYNSIQTFIESILAKQSESVAGESKTGEFVKALKGNGIHYLLTDNNTSKLVVEDLHGKAIGLLICDFNFGKLIKLQQIYKYLQQKDSNFIAIWIPTTWPEDCGHGSYTRLIQLMSWATFPHPQLVNLESTEACFVLLDKHGHIANHDALPLVMGWGMKFNPFIHYTISESFSSLESESCLEFLLHRMKIVGRKPMKSKMSFLYAEHPREWRKMKSKLEELTQILGSFEVLYVGYFSEKDMENLEQDYEDATQNMCWPSLSFSDMIMFWWRCKYLASEEVYELNKESNIMMESVHGLARLLCTTVMPNIDRRWFVLVDNGGVVTRGGEDVLQIIDKSDEILDGEGMAMRMVKDELMKSLSRGECSPIVKTFFRDEIHELPHHPQHRILYSASPSGYTCDVCQSHKANERNLRSYRCDECNWDMCDSCWYTYAMQQVELLPPPIDY